MRRWVLEYGWFVMMGGVILGLAFIAYELSVTRFNSEDNNQMLKSMVRGRCGEAAGR